MLPNIMFLPLFCGLFKQFVNKSIFILILCVSLTSLKYGFNLEIGSLFVIDQKFKEFQ